MKIFTRIMFLGLVMFLTTVSANAQGKWIKQKAQEETDKLTAALELDTKTAEKVYNVFLASYTKQKEITDEVKSEEITKEEKKAKLKQLWKDNTANIEAVLDANQVEKYRAYRGAGKKTPKVEKKPKKETPKKKAKKTQNNWTAQKAQKETDKLTEALGLDEEMSAKVYEVQLGAYTKLKEISDAEANGTITTTEKKTQVKQLWKDNTANIETALGKELTKKYRAYRKAEWEKKKKK